MKRSTIIKRLNTLSIYNESFMKYSSLRNPLLISNYFIKINKIRSSAIKTRETKAIQGTIYILKNKKSDTLQIVFHKEGKEISQNSPVNLSTILHVYKGNQYLCKTLRDYCRSNMLNSNKFENCENFFISLQRFTNSNNMVEVLKKDKGPTMKYYAVRVGKVIGIYFLWKDCEAQVKGYSGAEYKSFTSIMDAVEYIAFEASDH